MGRGGVSLCCFIRETTTKFQLVYQSAKERKGKERRGGQRREGGQGGDTGQDKVSGV